jgi:hypothetical protein
MHSEQSLVNRTGQSWVETPALAFFLGWFCGQTHWLKTGKTLGETENTEHSLSREGKKFDL